MCGIPLFAGAALGNLDPPPWTNFAHKPSPTDIKTAQVPDPSWEWAWPEWRVNRDDAISCDKNGWEYSFMFSKKFSWHGPKWWNSFVRRRAWIRRRIQKGIGYQANDPHLMAGGYFTVNSPEPPASGQPGSLAEDSSVLSGQRSGKSQELVSGDGEDDPPTVDIEAVEQLLKYLRRSRIDRERIEIVENYLEHAQDNLLGLKENMHEIMATFVFQTSRRLLLSRLMQIFDETAAREQQDDSPGTRERLANIKAAVQHADEEVRRLEYWSDVKQIAEAGESHGAAVQEEGWSQAFEGIDRSGPKIPNEEELP